MADVITDREDADRDAGRASSGDATPTRPIEEIRAESAVQRAIRVAVAPSSRLSEEPSIVVGPPLEPLAPLSTSLAGRGLLGGTGSRGSPDAPPASLDPAALPPGYLIDGSLVPIRLERRGPSRALLHARGDAGAPRRVVFTGPGIVGVDGRTRREVVVDGWRIELEIEPERRAMLRERARRGREATAHGGPTEVRAIIPGRVVSISVAPGEEITAGQQILVVEAMKMQNELRAPRDGVVKQIGVAVGRTIEVGDLLLVIE